jgi:hypothetical protein
MNTRGFGNAGDVKSSGGLERGITQGRLAEPGNAGGNEVQMKTLLSESRVIHGPLAGMAYARKRLPEVAYST